MAACLIGDILKIQVELIQQVCNNILHHILIVVHVTECSNLHLVEQEDLV